MLLKKKLNILILCEWDYAGCGYFLYDAIKKYTDHDVTQIRWHKSSFDFPCHVTNPSAKAIKSLCKKADVIHIHDDFTRIPDMMQERPCVVTYHGTRYRSAHKKFNARDKRKKWVQTASTFDLIQYGPSWLQDTRPDVSNHINRSNEFSVCQAPTKEVIKGVPSVRDAIKKSGIDIDIVWRKTWRETLERKGRAWVTIDQFRLGYGCNAVEAWLMKQPVVANSTDDSVLDLIRKQNDGQLPFIQCKENSSQISQVLTRLRDDKEYYDKWARIGYEYAVKVHSQEVVAKKALKYYRMAIDSFYSRTYTVQNFPGASPRGRKVRPKVVHFVDGGVALRYLGKNHGAVVYKGDVTKTEYKVRCDQIIYVNSSDVNGLLALREKTKTARGRKAKFAKKPIFVIA